MRLQIVMSVLKKTNGTLGETHTAGWGNCLAKGHRRQR